MDDKRTPAQKPRPPVAAQRPAAKPVVPRDPLEQRARRVADICPRCEKGRVMADGEAISCVDCGWFKWLDPDH